MSDRLSVWIRAETRATERQAPLVTDDAALLVRRDVTLTVEEAPQREFPLDAYVRAGCATAPTGSWTDAPPDTSILALKGLPDELVALCNRHILFGHVCKGQESAAELLSRFAEGGGILQNLEYLTGVAGRRLAAFNYWANCMGAVLAVPRRRRALDTPLLPLDRARWDALLASTDGSGERALLWAPLAAAGEGPAPPWKPPGSPRFAGDLEGTRNLDLAAPLDHDILVKTVLITRPTEPFLLLADLDVPDRRLSLISDITCDVGSECNVPPVYDTVCKWDRPARRLRASGRPLDLIAVDNLPSLPHDEAVRAFSTNLAPPLPRLGHGDSTWVPCLRAFARASRDTGTRTSGRTSMRADRTTASGIVHWTGTGPSTGRTGLGVLCDRADFGVLWDRAADRGRRRLAALGLGDRVETRSLDAGALELEVRPREVVVSMLPANEHPALLRLALTCRTHFACTSYTTAELEEEAKTADAEGLVMLTEAGLHPGIDRLLAYQLIERRGPKSATAPNSPSTSRRTAVACLRWRACGPERLPLLVQLGAPRSPGRARLAGAVRRRRRAPDSRLPQ